MTDVVQRSKAGIYSVGTKPTMRDINASDGMLMYGYRKVRESKGIGYIHAHRMKFGSAELANYKGRWVLVDVSDYWVVTARIGFTVRVAHGYVWMGIKCDVLEEG